jgi:hypothetical protein
MLPRIGLLLLCATLCAQPPPSPFVSRNVCPFECCTYRDWTAAQETPLYDAPGGQVIGAVHKGQHVTGVTGEVHTPRAARFVLKSADREHGIPAGAVVYALHYLGEGYCKVWYKGRTYDVDAAESSVPDFVTVWWAKVRMRDGKTGWVNMNEAKFNNVDACG